MRGDWGRGPQATDQGSRDLPRGDWRPIGEAIAVALPGAFAVAID
jgi:hypothetical protein